MSQASALSMRRHGLRARVAIRKMESRRQQSRAVSRGQGCQGCPQSAEGHASQEILVKEIRDAEIKQLRPHPEIPLITLLRLVHLGIACLAGILGRRGRIDRSSPSSVPGRNPASTSCRCTDRASTRGRLPGPAPAPARCAKPSGRRRGIERPKGLRARDTLDPYGAALACGVMVTMVCRVR